LFDYSFKLLINHGSVNIKSKDIKTLNKPNILKYYDEDVELLDQLDLGKNKSSIIFDKFEFVRKDLKFLTNSQIRLEIVNSIANNIKPIKSIHKETNLPYSAISINIKHLEEKSFLQSDYNGYVLNNLTKIFFKELIEFNKSISMVNKFSDFFNDHNFEEIDEDFLKDIVALNNSDIIKSSLIDVYKVHNTIIESILNSSDVYCVFTFIHPDYPIVFQELVTNNVNIRLLLSDDIYSSFKDLMKNKIVDRDLKNKNLNLKRFKDPKNLFLIGSNDFIYLGLFKNDNSFDQNRILFSTNENAIKWGNELFNKLYGFS
jgi:predicted transcriptional regulator